MTTSRPLPFAKGRKGSLVLPSRYLNLAEQQDALLSCRPAMNCSIKKLVALFFAGLGSFRALATRTTDAVILKFSDRKPIVVTPDDPGGFVDAIKTGTPRPG